MIGVHKLIETHLDFVNNFLTVKGYADYYDISESQAERLLQVAKESYEEMFGK